MHTLSDGVVLKGVPASRVQGLASEPWRRVTRQCHRGRTLTSRRHRVSGDAAFIRCIAASCTLTPSGAATSLG
jgi:hypothetical protein